MRKKTPKPALVSTPPNDPEKSDPPAAPKPVPETMEQAQARVQRCFATIQQVLQAHQCSIVPIIVTEQIGDGPAPTRMLVGANYYLKPNPIVAS